MKFKTVFVLSWILTFLLFSCAQIDSPQDMQSLTITPSPTLITATPVAASYTLAISGMDGKWQKIGEGMAAQITANIPGIKVNVKQTSSVMESLKLLTSSKAEMALGYDYYVVLANEGKLASIFPEAQPEKLSIKCGVEITRMPFPDYSLPMRIMLPLYEEPLFVMTTHASGIATLDDLKGKRVSVGETNSVTEELADYVLRGIGIAEADILHEQMSLPDSLQALQAGALDAFFWNGNDLAGLIESNPELVVIPINGGYAEKITQAAPEIFHVANKISGSESETLAVTVSLLVMQDFSPTQAQDIITIILENHDTVFSTGTVAINKQAQHFLHDGLSNYLKER